MTYAELCASLFSARRFGVKLGLDSMRTGLARLGSPERRLGKVVHIAGTNGKGSTQAMIRAGLEAAGLAVHAYTSPHLARFNERIRLAGQLVDDATLAAALEECEAANEGQPITFFEIATAAAFVLFARTPADFTLLASITLLLITVTMGIRTVTGVLFAGIALAFGPDIQASFPSLHDIVPIGVGLGAIGIARNPNGVFGGNTPVQSPAA